MNQYPTAPLLNDIVHFEASGGDVVRILLVDDEDTNIVVLSTQLERSGFSVDTAKNGADAIAMATAEPYDLVILDLIMPEVDGLAVLSAIRKTHGSNTLPIIMATASENGDDAIRCLDAGADDFVRKPVDFPIMLARINTQVGRKRANDAQRQSEERLALAIAGSHDGIWDWDLRQDAIYLSERWFDVIGLHRDAMQVPPSFWLDRIHGEDRQRVLQEFRACLDGIAKAFSSEHRVRHENGTYRWVLVRGVAARSPDGEPYRVAGSLTDITDRKAVDRLTGLPNRAPLSERIDRSLSRIRRNPDQIGALFVINVDSVALINEGYGESFGDLALKTVAGRLTDTLRPTDIVASLGGDEFGVFLDRIDEPANALSIGRRLQQVISAPIHGDEKTITVTAGLGVVVTADRHEVGADLISEAYAALNRAKRSGKSGIALFDEKMQSAAARRLDLEQELRRAIEDDQIQLAYQPIIDLASGGIVGFEGLARWHHPERGVVSPGEFIPVAEDSGLILPMTERLIDVAARTAAAWTESYAKGREFFVSVNLSARSFETPELVEHTRNILAKYEIPASVLEFEVTESQMMKDIEAARHALDAFREVGVRIALDDFGTGYSSLSYLTNLPFDTLKIDRSFIDKVDEAPGKQKILQAIIAMGRSLDIKIVGEGVETWAEHETVSRLGCDYGQGYKYARPVPAEDLRDTLDAWRVDLTADRT